MAYKTVGLIGKTGHQGTAQSLNVLLDYLSAKGCKILAQDRIAGEIDTTHVEVCDLATIGQRAELAVVVGGDGNMLGAARKLALFDIDVVGVNRGNLGFLTDISPDDIVRQMDCIFAGQCIREKRFLLEVEVFSQAQLKSTNVAVNEVVLHHGKVAHMMEFELYLDDDFVFSQRSDGIIVATPTGSTAYSLSGGGPILMPNLNALTLVPMFPHTLSSRPIVVDADSTIKIVAGAENTDNLQVSCDSHIVLEVLPGDEIHIRKSPATLRAVHPSDYDYFNVLRTKLNWGTKLY